MDLGIARRILQVFATYSVESRKSRRVFGETLGHDWKSFSELYERCFEAIYAYIAFRTAPAGPELVQDITQETFLAAFQSLQEKPASIPDVAWLRAIARNKVADHFRRRAVSTRSSAAWLDVVDHLSASSALEPRVDAEQVAETLRKIGPGYASLLEEKYLDRLTVKQMADLRQTTIKAVESALTRAREAFRRQYGLVAQN